MSSLLLVRHSLLIDIPNHRLISASSVRQVHSVDAVKHRPCIELAGISSASYSDVLAEFPDITKPSFDASSVPAHSVRHLVPTTGPPVFAHARPLFGDKLQVAKTEFDSMFFFYVRSLLSLTKMLPAVHVKSMSSPDTSYLK